MIEELLEKMVHYFGQDVSRINHAFKVFSFAKIISKEQEFSCETRQIIDCSAVLHDVGIKESERKYNSVAGNYQEVEGPPIARKILSDFNLSEKIIDRVCHIIGNHHSYDKIDGLDFQILVEADFLVNIYEGNLDKESVKNICDHTFKTDKGRELLKTMYLEKGVNNEIS